MPSKSKKNNKKVLTRGVVSDDVKDYSNDPYFIKKAEASKEVIRKYGLPKELIARQK